LFCISDRTEEALTNVASGKEDVDFMLVDWREKYVDTVSGFTTCDSGEVISLFGGIFI